MKLSKFNFKPIRIIGIETYFGEKGLVFDNGLVVLSYHRTCCCESVFADFSYILNYNSMGGEADKSIYEMEFEPNFYEHIIKVEGEGFIIKACNDTIGNKVFIPCYNIQNGFYSDDLRLLIFNKKDISNYKTAEELIQSGFELINISDCHTEQEM